MKDYSVMFYLEPVEIQVKAKNKSEAKKKALARLNRKKPSSLIRRTYPSNKQDLFIDEL